MPRFSANLGFLWADLPLTDAIRHAAKAGFDAVECHWPYDYPASEIRKLLQETGLPMLSINTWPGDRAAGDFGMAALPGKSQHAEQAIREAIDYARAISAPHVHVMAGVASGPSAHSTFVRNLRFAVHYARDSAVTILIEAINHEDAPGYFLHSTGQAETLIREVGSSRLKLMFDCYHVQKTEGDVMQRLEALLPIIGHIQFADVPGRGVPGSGAMDYSSIFARIDQLGYDRPLGAEYRPEGATASSLDWLHKFRT